MERPCSRAFPGSTPEMEGVESITRAFPPERSTMITGVFTRFGLLRISTLARRWVMSRQAIFMGILE